MSTAKKYSLSGLKQIMRDNKIKGVTLMNKPEMLEALNKLDFVPNEALEKKKTLKDTKNYCNRNKPRKVIAKYFETGLIRNIHESITLPFYLHAVA